VIDTLFKAVFRFSCIKGHTVLRALEAALKDGGTDDRLMQTVEGLPMPTRVIESE
jgi:hypothetical protein